jgi:competence protein ComEC
MRLRFLVFSIGLAQALLLSSCSNVDKPASSPVFTFTVVNVGQALSQVGLVGSGAVVWDMGDSAGTREWMKTYERLKEPYIRSIVISHTHADHMDGLLLLGSLAGFSGALITSAYEDTALLLSKCGQVRQRIRLRLISAGDTLGGLDGVLIECIWPPKGLDTAGFSLSEDDKNRYSLCFLVRHGATSVCITSDIDTAAERELAARYGFGLRSDIVVFPHHGSSGSADPVFFGYVDPKAAIISCGYNNVYGLPAHNSLALLFQMRVPLYETDRQGTVSAASNGYYWEFTCDKGQ